MAEYYNVTTNLGDAEIANAIATNTKLNITHIAFGDGNGSVPTPNKARTSLVREVHRQAVTKYERHATNANWIVIETIIPSDVGGFTIREMGIIANGKLISHGSHAPFEKVADPSGVSEYRLRFTQNVTDGSVVEISLDESLVYASQAWVNENYIPRSEIVDNLTTNDATKPASAKQAKLLQDNKLDKTDLKDASTTQKGIVQLNNTLTSSATDEALTAEQGKVLHEIATGHKQYVLTNRTHSVAYQNPTDYLMFVNITAQSSSGSGREVETSQDGVTWTSIGQTGQSGDGENTFFVVLPRYFYRINGVTTSIAYWVEWRL